MVFQSLTVQDPFFNKKEQNNYKQRNKVQICCFLNTWASSVVLHLTHSPSAREQCVPRSGVPQDSHSVDLNPDLLIMGRPLYLLNYMLVLFLNFWDTFIVYKHFQIFFIFIRAQQHLSHKTKTF